MIKLRFIFSMLFLPALVFAQTGKLLSKDKATVIGYIDQHKDSLIKWSKQIWEYAESSFNEIKSSQLLIDILQKEGFIIEKNLCGLPTVFMASYGKGKPVIGLYGEYDADANASNKTVPRKDELVTGGYGHGGHHNLLGVGSLGAALAIK
jgi:aminobenzoyl-glutamate utilization protein B